MYTCTHAWTHCTRACPRARTHTHTHTHTHACTRAGVTRIFLLFIFFLCMCGCESVRACRGGYFEMFDILGAHFGVFNSQRHFPSSFFLSSLYWPWDPLSSLESTPVSIYVPKQVDCNMCRFSKLLLLSLFFCKDGSDRLMKRDSCFLLLL